MKATVLDGRDAMWKFIIVLTTMHSGDAGSAVMEFAACLNQALHANRNTEETRASTIRALAEKAAYLVGLEVVDEPPAFNDYNDTDMQDQALVWYGYGYEDGENGMAPEPQARKEWAR